MLRNRSAPNGDIDMRSKGNGVSTYFENIRALQEKVITSQKDELIEIASKMAEIVKRDDRIFTFGTGHSHLLAEESYYRAGGIAAAVPMFAPMILMLHESARMSSQVERMPELATAILEEYEPEAGEMLIIYADSGVNGLPVQLAIEAKERGVVVVGVCSFKYTSIAPLSKVGKRLPEVVDYALDNHGTPGDALVALENSTWRVAASSTITGALIWNCLLTEMAFQLNEDGYEIPLIASFNMPGAAEHNAGLLEKWSKINPHLPARNIKS
jgi:uncharacterized phosphosugar-binding protein